MGDRDERDEMANAVWRETHWWDNRRNTVDQQVITDWIAAKFREQAKREAELEEQLVKRDNEIARLVLLLEKDEPEIAEQSREIERLNLELQRRDKCSYLGPMRNCPTHGESAEIAALRAANAEAEKRSKLLRSPNSQQIGCYCKPGRCMAPVVMGQQMPCLDPDKARAAMEAK